MSTAEIFIHHEVSQEQVMEVWTQVFDVLNSKIRNSMALTNIAEQLHGSPLPILGTRNSNTPQDSRTHDRGPSRFLGRTKDPSP